MIDWTVSRRACLAGMAALPLAPGLARAETIGAITRLDPALDAIVDVHSPIEVVATGIQWAEGPVWVKQGGFLLFSDPPANIAYRLAPGGGKTEWLKPSGLAGAIPEGVREPGSNGMTIDAQGRLLMADSGTRAIAAVDLATRRKTILADRYQGKRFNSCNDLAIGRHGAIYFTDPPYGLAGGDKSPLKELDFNGVFRLSPDGGVDVVAKDLSRPNGVGVSPDHRTLYVAMSDSERPQILAYALDKDGAATGQMRVFHDFSEQLAQKLPGWPDGLKVDAAGRVWASGPGGIYVLSPQGKALGCISTGKPTANCAFGEDGKTLFLTSSDMVARVRLKVSGWAA